VPRKGEHHGSGSAHASSVRDEPRGSRNERTRHRACPTTATPTEWLLEGKEVTEIDGRTRTENPAELAGRANARRPETVSGQRFSSAERQICRLWIGSGRGLGGRAHPGPGDAVSHRDRTPRLMPGRCGVCGSLLVAKGRQEIAGGFQVGLFDFGDWIGLHRENRVIRTNEKLPRDTMSRGEVLRLSFRRGRRSREVPSNCRTGRGESVRSSARSIRPPVVSREPASRLRSRESRQVTNSAEGIVNLGKLTPSIGIWGEDFNVKSTGRHFLLAKLCLPSWSSLVTIFPKTASRERQLPVFRVHPIPTRKKASGERQLSVFRSTPARTYEDREQTLPPRLGGHSDDSWP
jgi:hypothetical protein